jgi:hypothetical protein
LDDEELVVVGSNVGLVQGGVVDLIALQSNNTGALDVARTGGKKL